MKYLLITVSFFCCLWIDANAQQQPFSGSPSADTAGFDYIAQKRLEKELSYTDSSAHARIRKMHNRWYDFWRGRVGKDTLGAGVFAPLVQATMHGLRQPAFCSNYNYNGNWSYFGPVRDNFGAAKDSMGRVISIWVSPADENYILAGAGTGGLWKTTNGGADWKNITDQINDPQITGTMGVSQIAVHPDFLNYIYISTGVIQGGPQYGLGLQYSVDGGVIWHTDYNFQALTGNNATWGFEINRKYLKMAYSPATKRLYLITDRKIYMKPSFNQNWQDITPAVFTNLPPAYYDAQQQPVKYTLADFECTQYPAGNIIFVTSGKNATQYILTLNESNNQWSSYGVVIPGPGTLADLTVLDIALTQHDKIYWNLWWNGAGRLYRTNANGSNISLRSSFSASYHPLCITAARNNENRVYLGDGRGSYSGESIEKSLDGGVTWTNVCKTHADSRCIRLYKEGSAADGQDDVLFSGTDGGVAKKPALSYQFHSISGRGLHIAQFNSMSSNPTNSGMLAAGSADNGTHTYYKNQPVPWQVPVYGDGLNSAFSQNGSNRVFTQSNSGVEPSVLFQPAAGAQPALVQTSYNPGATPDWSFSYRWHNPMKVDARNTLRMAKHFVFKQNTPGVWESAFGSGINDMSEPKPLITMNGSDAANLRQIRGNKKPMDFIISERYPEIAYIAYDNVFWGQQDPFTPNLQNLLRSKNIGTSSQSWENISPQVFGFPISDIETDPANPGRIWVCYGGVKTDEITVPHADRENRVLYSDNYGDSWTDISAGLPMIPVHKIKYVEGSDDALFAGTELGVYRWNKGQGIWQCFNDGMPKCIVSEMEINYCTGKLRIATNGRGIWETDIAADMGAYTPGYVHTITTGTTWTENKTVNGSILVKAGATLAIDHCTIFMPYKGKITVERGARLVVDGATITNNCSGSLWYGIEIAGNNRRRAIPQYQGVVELRNGALLQHARCALSNFTNGGSQAGGLIYASNSHIDNCVKAVALNNTRALFYNSDGTITCSFNNVSFIKDDPAYVIDQLGYFASWNMEKGVELVNCKFSYSVPAANVPYGQRYWGAHIQSTGAKVEGCTFEGYDRGIYATDYNGSGRPVDITTSSFYKNNISIMLAGNTYGTVGQNNIDQMVMPPSNYYNPKAVGIYLDKVQGAFIGCDNAITSNVTGPQTIGVLSNNGKWYGAMIMKNNLFNLSRGFQSQGHNNALRLRCNTFKNDRYGMAINPQLFFWNNGSFNNQGTGCNGGVQIQANNYFFSNTKDIASYQVPAWTYYAASDQGQMPATWSGSVTVVPQCSSSAGFLFASCTYCGGYLELGQRPRIQLIQLYRDSDKYGETGRLLYGAIINRHHIENAIPELITFLTEENDPVSQRLLLPLSIDQDQYALAQETIGVMDIPEEEREAYFAYYGLLNDFTNNDRLPGSITDVEKDMLMNIAANEWDIAHFAMALLEYGELYTWEHPIDDMPDDEMEVSSKGGINSPADNNDAGSAGSTKGSFLADASPNPARTFTTIKIWVSDADSYKKPLLSVKSTTGNALFQHALEKGWNKIKVPVQLWSNGIYFYSLSVAGHVLETKKLSVMK